MTVAQREMIPLFDVEITDDDLAAIEEVLRSGWLTFGPKGLAFEERFAQWLGVRHAVLVSSCTSALHLAYLAAGVGPGDEVIVPSFTFAATAAAAVYCGATPVFADVLGPHDLSIDPDEVRRLITPRTKAVAAVHFAGYAAPLAELVALCEEHGLALIEDAAHAPLASADGRALGTFGLAGCFSFFSNKVLSAGEGGLLATDDDEVAATARQLRSHGMTAATWDRHKGKADGYDVERPGFNYRYDEVRSALLLSRIERLEADVAERRRLTMRYREKLAGLPGVVVPYRDEQVAESTCYVMPIMLEREGLQQPVRLGLRERYGVQTSLLYPGTHEFTAYRERWPGVQLPRSERASRCEVTLPLFGHLTDLEQDRVVAALAAELKAAA